jgi:hypothetical protein
MKGGKTWLQIEFLVINHVLSNIHASKNRAQLSAHAKNRPDQHPSRQGPRVLPENQSRRLKRLAAA